MALVLRKTRKVDANTPEEGVLRLAGETAADRVTVTILDCDSERQRGHWARAFIRLGWTSGHIKAEKLVKVGQRWEMALANLALTATLVQRDGATASYSVCGLSPLLDVLVTELPILRVEYSEGKIFGSGRPDEKLTTKKNALGVYVSATVSSASPPVVREPVADVPPLPVVHRARKGKNTGKDALEYAQEEAREARAKTAIGTGAIPQAPQEACLYPSRDERHPRFVDIDVKDIIPSQTEAISLFVWDSMM